MKSALQKDEAFLADVRRVLAARGRALWWLGQSGFLVAQHGRALVLDARAAGFAAAAAAVALRAPLLAVILVAAVATAIVRLL